MASDTITPILPQDYHREIGPKLWHWEQVYFGPNKSNYPGSDVAENSRRYVVMKGDIIAHPTNGDWNVTYVSERHIPTVEPRAVVNGDAVIDAIIVPSNTFSRRADVVNVDHTALPVKYTVNGRVFIMGSQASHYKIFMGTDISETGRTLTAKYNNLGQIVGDEVDLELAAFEKDVTNLTIKTPKSGYMRELPADGELVTLVSYTVDGRMHDAQPLIVSHENFAQASKPTKVIVDIALVTPYLSKTENDVIEIPRNMNLNALALFGVLTYNDGSVSPHIPVNGNKFTLLGAEAFTASVDMGSVGIVLSYLLAPDESALNTVGVVKRYKPKAYTLKTIPSDAAYSVKLFVIPTWDNKALKWTLRYMLYDLRRDMRRDVTDLVEPSKGFLFNPGLFGQSQTVKVAINLANLGSNYQFYRPNQAFTITLLKTGTSKNPTAYYNFSYSTGVNLGDLLVANCTVANGKSTVDLSCGKTTTKAYLAEIYRNIEVIHVGDVAAPPNPTKFRLRHLGASTATEYPIDSIVKPLNNPGGTWQQGGTVVIEFIAESSGKVLELGALAYPVNVV